jgi:glyoxylase-like metal-dependent hydrolase (beta-lactamase superfamily II)/rhodanese-related sulfurtransferase
MSGLIIPIVDEGLGNSSYLVNLGDGCALAVDASLDLRGLDATAARRGLRVVFAADTHLHADFLSGATRLAARDGATVYASAAGQREFPYTGLADGDEVDLGGLTLRVWATPGHTGEHLAFLLLDGDRTLGVFTGGSLLVGSAARTDLAGAEQTEPLARAQYASLRRLTILPDSTPIFPTHGAGSFCSAPPGADRTSTIGREKATNPLLAAPNEDTFIAQLLGSLGSYPPYFARLPELNRRGPALPSDQAVLSDLTPAQVVALRAAGAEIIDTRTPVAYAAGHVPGSLAITLRGVFATWLGWLVKDPATPLVFVRDDNQDPEEIVWQARKVGYDNFAGQLDVTAWSDSGQPLATVPLLDPADTNRAQAEGYRILDVRQTTEYAAGHVRTASNIELGTLAHASLPTGPLVTMCGHGERATTAASILERHGSHDIAVAAGGPEEWAAATDSTLDRST